MKLFTKLSSVILALGLASTASAADTVIYITGATAFRNAANQAILKYLGAGLNNGTGVNVDCLPVTALGAFSTTRPGAPGTGDATIGRFGYTGSSWANSRAMTVIANDFPIVGDRTIIKTSWSGSEAGIKAVVDPGTTTVKYLPASYDAPGDTTSLTAAGVPGLADPTTHASLFESHAGGDICFTDTWQETSNFFGGSYPTLTEAVNSGNNPVGIVPFLFVKQNGAPANITNMTANGARSLWLTTGYTDAQMLSGNAADAGIRIYGIGRDMDSGTRFINLAETGIGTKTFVKNWRPNILRGGTAVTAYPASVGAATYNTVSGSNTITCSVSTASINLCAGMTVTGAGIPANSIVGSLSGTTTFTIIKSTDSTANNATASAIGISLTISKNVALAQGTTNGLATSNAWYKVPIQVVNGVTSTSVSNGGENSGSVISSFLTRTSTNALGYCIGFLSPSDALTALQGAPGTVGTALTYEGVGIVTSQDPILTFDFTPIKTGAYKYWSYEHMYYDAATIGATKKTVADGICEQIYSVDAGALSNTVAIDASVKVKRAGTHIDGSNIIMNSYTLP